jgi:hypothetical protein
VNELVLADISVGANGGAGATSFAVHIPDRSPSIHATHDRSRQGKKIKNLCKLCNLKNYAEFF